MRALRPRLSRGGLESEGRRSNNATKSFLVLLLIAAGFGALLWTQHGLLIDVKAEIVLAARSRARAEAEAGGQTSQESSKDGPRTLSFQVCNGFANQRLSVLYGVLIAAKTGRMPVLPTLITDGTMDTDQQVLVSDSNAQPFSQLYDVPFFTRSLKKFGVNIAPSLDPTAQAACTRVTLEQLGWDAMWALNGSQYSMTRHLCLDCPLFKLRPTDILPADYDLMWGVLEAFKPSRQTGAISGGATAALARMHKAGHFNFLHLRMERDWEQHCVRWTAIKDGIVRDNCFNNTDDIDVSLKLFGFSPSVPLYVGSYWPAVDPERSERVLARLAAANYNVIRSTDIMPQAAKLRREQLALVEYEIGLAASRFIGNSVSTFSALAMLQRRNRGHWAAYYNGGNIPLIQALPIHRLPWVFTYNSWSSAYDYLLKGAVRSAAKHSGLKPYCMFTGNTSSPVYRWLISMNVTMIKHELAWEPQLLAKAAHHMKENIQHSHLYKNPDMLVSTFQRVDLPVIPVLDQYQYVLYTDADVYFRRRISLESFGLPLTPTVAMSWEFANVFPYNAGIMLLHLPSMRASYTAFLAFILKNDKGLFFGSYGPADQGALNQYYEADLKAHLLPQAFNTKPYHDFSEDASIVHFHGPKPHEYLKYVETGKCDFFYVCEAGLLKTLCTYVKEWLEFVPEFRVAQELHSACKVLGSATAFDLMKKLHPNTTRRRL